MVTDRPSRKAPRQFLESDQLRSLKLPTDERLRSAANRIEFAMKSDSRSAIREACAEFLSDACEFYEVPLPEIRVLTARPLRMREGGWASELFGDYSPHTMQMRIWTRTAVRKQMTSFGTFFSTLCHEFCHHLDCCSLGFRSSPHTRGFYERTAILYHHARGTPRKQLVRIRAPRERWRIDWSRINRGPQALTSKTSAG
jgi:hypothetical protein